MGERALPRCEQLHCLIDAARDGDGLHEDEGIRRRLVGAIVDGRRDRGHAEGGDGREDVPGQVAGEGGITRIVPAKGTSHRGVGSVEGIGAIRVAIAPAARHRRERTLDELQAKPQPGRAGRHGHVDARVDVEAHRCTRLRACLCSRERRERREQSSQSTRKPTVGGETGTTRGVHRPSLREPTRPSARSEHR